MNPANLCHLEGIVAGDCWTRWACRERGQVRFWLAIGGQRLLCALELHSAAEVWRLEREIQDGRAVRLDAQARALDPDPREASPGVIFVAECCQLDGLDVSARHVDRLSRLHGKAAAAGDRELALEEAQR
jgi:hypothetical protein